MSTVSNYVQYIGKGVVQGYANIIPPFAISSRQAVGPGGVPVTQAGIGDIVRVGYATAGSSSFDFTYAGGYSGNNGNINFALATLNICKYQPLTLTDTEILRLGSPEAAMAQGVVLGRRLAGDVLSASYAATIGASSYPNSSSYASTAFTASSMVGPADLDNYANTQNWPDGDRYMVAGTTLWNKLMQNSGIVASSNFGFNSAVAQTARLTNVYGFVPYKTSLALPLGATGFVCTPNAMSLTTVYHQPQEASQKVVNDAYAITDDMSGATLGFYEYYSPSTRTLTRVFDCLAAATVLDPNALYLIK